MFASQLALQLSAPRVSPSLEDGSAVIGLTAGAVLPMLADVPARARLVFLWSDSRAAACRAPIHRATAGLVFLDGLCQLPFRSASVDCVVLDGRLGGPGRWRDRRQVQLTTLREIARVLKPDGQVVVTLPTGALHRDSSGTSWARRLLAAWTWTRTIARSRLIRSRVIYLRYDGPRLAEIHPFDHAGRSVRTLSADRKAMVLDAAPAQAARTSAIDALLEHVSDALGFASRDRLQIQRFVVRKIGKVALIVRGPDGRRFLIRIPHSPIALARAERNRAALQKLHANIALPERLRRLVPRALVQGQCRDYVYYVEEALGGTSFESREAVLTDARWEPDAVCFICDLHELTRQVGIVDRACFGQLVEAPLQRIEDACAPELRHVVPRLAQLIEEGVLGRPLPFTWSHGDFALGNCLYDADGRLSAVVDWELFSDPGLPLLDLLQLVRIPSESSVNPCWQRVDMLCDMLRDSSAVFDSPVLGRYVQRMGIAPQIVPALVLMHWVDHVGNRIDGRRADRGWMRRRVHAPLAMFKEVLAS